jgi:hypothetical protein
MIFSRGAVSEKVVAGFSPETATNKNQAVFNLSGKTKTTWAAGRGKEGGQSRKGLA